MENLVINATITTTSMKQPEDKRYQQDIPTKTAYLQVSEEESKKLKEFGLTEYTPEDGEPFFCIKFAREPKFYDINKGKDEEPIDWSTVVQNEFKFNNFSFENVRLNIIKGESSGNVFYRIQAILGDEKNLTEIKPTNPFA